jgi:hypothetical protein
MFLHRGARWVGVQLILLHSGEKMGAYSLILLHRGTEWVGVSLILLHRGTMWSAVLHTVTLRVVRGILLNIYRITFVIGNCDCHKIYLSHRLYLEQSLETSLISMERSGQQEHLPHP